MPAPIDKSYTVTRPGGVAHGGRFSARLSLAVTDAADVLVANTQLDQGLPRTVSLTATDAPDTVYSNVMETEAVVGTYRSTQPRLFQGHETLYRPTILSGGLGFSALSDLVLMPTKTYVDVGAGWRWTNSGGDWIDANGTAGGLVPLASFSPPALGSTVVAAYSVDVKNALEYVRTRSKPAAFLIGRYSGTGPRAAAGLYGAYAPPNIAVTYTDGTSATLACKVWVSTASSGSELVPQAGGDSLDFPIAAEWEYPLKPIQTATVSITVTEHWSGAASIGFFVANPPQNNDPVTGTDGLAAQAGALDEGIFNVPGILGAHRYLDGTTIDDVNYVGPAINNYYETSFDPALWGGTPNTTKAPHVFQNTGSQIASAKWLGLDTIYNSIVDSTYEGEGFEPLAPGLGAIRTTMPDAGVQTGEPSEYGNNGGSNAFLYLPADQSGLVDRIFVRVYYRIGTPVSPTHIDRRQYYRPPSHAWASLGGKWGITPFHWYSKAGAYPNSTGSGGQYGYQMRHAWGVVDEVTGGPDEGGISSGWHFYDFYNQNPPGYNYTTDKGYLTQWGQRGGLGAVLYAGRWYCVEYEMKLNSIDVENPATPGKFWAPDGELRTWIDGRLVYERTGLVFRVGPAATWSPVGAAEMRPHRNLGIQGLWMNWYHGGVTENSYPMSMFTTGLAYGTSRIGPMKLNQAPTWAASVPVNIWTELSSMQRFGVWCQANIPYYGQYGPRAMNSIINAYCDPATDEVGQAQYYYGGGHGDGTCDAVIKCDLNTLEWSLVSSPTPPSTYPVAGVYPSGVSTVAVAGTTAAYYLTEAEGLDPVIDAGKIAPKLSRAVTHMYASAVFRGGKYYCFYSGYGECDVETGTWAPEGRYIAPPSVIGPFAWSVHDPVNDRAFVARTISGAPVDRIWEYNYSTRTFVATHSFPGGTVQYRASVTMAVKADRKIWIWVSSGPVYTTAIFNQGYIFDMDSKTFKQFTLTGADIGSTTLECTPGWWDGRKIRRINTSNFSTRDFVFSIDPNQTPVSGTGVSPTPWVLTQTSTPIPSPNNGGITYTYSRIFYHPEAECAMFIPRSGDGSTAGDASGLTSGGKYWALRLTD